MLSSQHAVEVILALVETSATPGVRGVRTGLVGVVQLQTQYLAGVIDLVLAALFKPQSW